MFHINRFRTYFSFYFILFPIFIWGQEQKIKPGDAIEIMVYGHEELTQAVIVDEEGQVDFPSLEGVPIDGINLDQFQEILVAQLSRYLDKRPFVALRFTERYPIEVVVLGQVVKPGMYPIMNIATPLGAIGEAGGFKPGAKLKNIQLLRVETGDTNKFFIDMEKFYLEGDLSYLPLLKDGDVIIVPGDPFATKVNVLGAVERPGSYDATFRANLLNVLFLAGGPTDDANLKKIKLISLSEGQPHEVQINVKKILKSKASQYIPIVQPGDVVYVPEKFISWGKFLGIVRDITTFTTLYLILRWGRRW